MKYITGRPFADPDNAARKLVEIANAAKRRGTAVSISI
jgi:hypothetical protein